MSSSFGRIEIALLAALLLLVCVVPVSIAQAPSLPPESSPIAAEGPIPSSMPAPEAPPFILLDTDCAQRYNKPTVGNWVCTRSSYGDPEWVHLGDLIIEGDFEMPVSAQRKEGYSYSFRPTVFGNVSISGSLIYTDAPEASLWVEGCPIVKSIVFDWSHISEPLSYTPSSGYVYTEPLIVQYGTNCTLPLRDQNISLTYKKNTRSCRIFQPKLTPVILSSNSKSQWLYAEISLTSRCSTLPVLYAVISLFFTGVIISVIAIIIKRLV